MSAEYLGLHFQEGLLKAGAIDFGIAQQLMKKGRPGFLLRVLLREDQLPAVSSYLFQHTSTIGVRYHRVERKELDRSMEEMQTPYGAVKVKESKLPNQQIKRKPEYEDIQRLAQERGISPLQLLQALNLSSADFQKEGEG